MPINHLTRSMTPEIVGRVAFLRASDHKLHGTCDVTEVVGVRSNVFCNIPVMQLPDRGGEFLATEHRTLIARQLDIRGSA
jgi:hypothetical protein